MGPEASARAMARGDAASWGVAPEKTGRIVVRGGGEKPGIAWPAEAFAPHERRHKHCVSAPPEGCVNATGE
jgi:hypothetical protein